MEEKQNGYELVTSERGYHIWRKIVNGRGYWKASTYDKPEEMFDITYEQALGREPIITTQTEALRHTLGKLLLPRR